MTPDLLAALAGGEGRQASGRAADPAARWRATVSGRTRRRRARSPRRPPGALRDDAAPTVTLDGEAWFLHPHNPPLRLIVVGAVHIAQALVPMAHQLGFAVTVVDPRRAWATAERFPGITLIHEWTDDAWSRWRPTAAPRW